MREFVRRSSMISRLLFSTLGVFMIWAAAAHATTITFTNTVVDFNGTGNGTVLGVLSLHQNGSETGSTFPAAPGSSGNAENTNQYFAQAGTAVTALVDANGNVALIFQVNESGKTDPVTLTSFSLDFYNPDNTLNHSVQALGTPINGLTGVGQGTSGWEFIVNFDASDLAFLNTAGTHLGATGSVNNTADGADNFFFARASEVSPVPEPGSMLLIGSGLAGLGLLGRRRIRRS